MIEFIFYAFLWCSSVGASASNNISIPEEIMEKIKIKYSLNKEKPLRISLVNMDVSIVGQDLNFKKTLGIQQNTLDLSQVITSRHKKFTVSIALTEKVQEQPVLFFSSQYEPIKIGNDEFGLACGETLMIEKKLSELNMPGVEVSNLSSHYIHIIGGDYFLSYLQGSTLKVGYFKIRDGRLIQKMCKVGVE